MCRPFACHGKNGSGVSVMDGCVGGGGLVGGGGFVGWMTCGVGDRNCVGITMVGGSVGKTKLVG